MELEIPLYKQRLALFPRTTRIEGSPENGELTIAGLRLSELVAEYGTPLYLYDRATLDAAVQDYRAALSAAYPGNSGVTYAGKAFLNIAIAQWVHENDLWLDCTGIGELATARRSGLPRRQILVHGVSKSLADLQTAAAQAGTIVIDNLSELERLVDMLQPDMAAQPNLWLRLRPGLAVETHSYTQTGQDDSKFGMSPAEFEQAVTLCLAEKLPLKGIHFHQGSHFHDPSPLEPAIETALDLVARVRQATGWTPEFFCPGGGWGVPYHEADLPHQPVEAYVSFIAARLSLGCRKRALPLPQLQLEPGRSLVARAGVAIYRVEAIKRTTHRRWILLDGGMADNPRPALYRARYSALPVCGPGRAQAGPVWLAGPYCESGDILIEDLSLPDIQAGELMAVPVSGAYHLSMGSNYNGARRPAVIWLDEGRAALIQRRETPEELSRRDLPLPGKALQSTAPSNPLEQPRDPS